MSDRKSKNLFIASAAAAMVAGSSPSANATRPSNKVLISHPSLPAVTSRAAEQRAALGDSSVISDAQPQRGAIDLPSIRAFQRGRQSLAETALAVTLLGGAVTMAATLVAQLIG